MYLYELFSHSDRFSYRAHLLSGASYVLILCTALTFLPPFLLTYYTGDFWPKESIYSEQPRLANSTKYILTIDNDATTNRFFMSSYSTLNVNFQTRLLFGDTIVSSYDIDGDGLIDQFRVSFDIVFSKVTTTTQVSINNINLWLMFQYALRGKQHINMETMALVSIVPTSDLTANMNTNITVYGKLVFSQRQAIQSAGSESIYNTSIIDTDSSSSPDIDSILDGYFTRKYYTSYQTQYVWMTPRSTTSSTNDILTVNVIVNIGRQSIRYTPGFWQNFKWGWIQYISVLLPFIVVFNRLKLFVYSNQFVRTLVQLPFDRKRHQA